jgi:hypothetical protein
MENYKLKEQDFLALWQYFSEDAAKIKDKLWTIASWLYALMSGLLGFVVKYQIEGKETSVFWTVAMGAVGIALSYYTWYMIEQYGKHIRTGWNVTAYLRTQIKGMEAIWASRKSDDKDDGEGVPRFVRPLQWLAVGYGVGFFLVLIF